MEREEIIAQAAQLGWEERDGMLQKEFAFRDFHAALAFVNTAGEIAEELHHHPEIWFTWGKVRLQITTHDAGGVTNKDLGFARRIEALF